MKVKFKKLHPSAIIPFYAKPGDAGLDLTAIEMEVEKKRAGIISYKTGLAVEIPEGYVGLIFPRSSIYKTYATLANSVGVIDSGYRGEIILKMRYNTFDDRTMYKRGDKIGQLVIIPHPIIEPLEANELSDTERGDGGFGHTD